MTGFRSAAYVALGGNLPSDVGPPDQTLAAAITALENADIAVRARSRFFATPCFPAGAGPDYVNAVIEVECSLSPEDLLGVLHEVEAKFHRKREQRWGMRTLDLDLLSFGDQVWPDLLAYEAWRNLPPEDQINHAPDQLILPHPRLQDRAFVLVPLCDIAPEWVHPVLKRTARNLCGALPPDGIRAVQPL